MLHVGLDSEHHEKLVGQRAQRPSVVAGDPAQPARDRLEQPVAGDVPVPVVDACEVVESIENTTVSSRRLTSSVMSDWQTIAPGTFPAWGSGPARPSRPTFASLRRMQRHLEVRVIARMGASATTRGRHCRE
jgi:hypothetical protein